MKCPECGKTHKENQGMQCACGYRFIFDPRVTGGLTDAEFIESIDSASANGTYYFTKNQLYTAYCRVKAGGSSRAGGLVVFAFLLTIFAFFFWSDRNGPNVFSLFFAAAALLCLIIGVRTAMGPRQAPSREGFENAVQLWLYSGKTIDRLITEPRLGSPPPEYEEGDIYDYGVERLLFVQQDMLVDLLVLNGFHAEERTLVVSDNIYPDYLMHLADEAFRKNPHIPMFHLHDTTLSSPKGFLPSPFYRYDVIDLGLFPADVKRIRAIKAIRPKNMKYIIPVDMIPYSLLVAMLSEAMEQGVPFAPILGAVTGKRAWGRRGGGPSGYG